MAIKGLRIGEVFILNGEEYIINWRTHNNGREEWKQPNLIKLSQAILKTSRKKDARARGVEPAQKNTPSFFGIKLRKMKGGFKKDE